VPALCRFAQQIFGSISEEDHGNESNDATATTSTPSASDPDPDVDMDMDLRCEIICSASSTLTGDSEADMTALNREVASYLLKTQMASQYSAKNAALSFWQKHADDFQKLAAMACEFLAVNAGSVPVECLFSMTGLVLNSKRSCLSPYKLNMITFLHDNYSYV